MILDTVIVHSKWETDCRYQKSHPSSCQLWQSQMVGCSSWVLKGKTRGCVNSVAYWKGKPRGCVNSTVYWKGKLRGCLNSTERENPEAVWTLLKGKTQRLCKLYCLLKGKTQRLCKLYCLLKGKTQRLCQLKCLNLKGKTSGCVNSTAYWKGKPESVWILLLIERENQRLCELYGLLKGKTRDGSSWCVLLLVWSHGNFCISCNSCIVHV